MTKMASKKPKGVGFMNNPGFVERLLRRAAKHNAPKDYDDPAGGLDLLYLWFAIAMFLVTVIGGLFLRINR